MILIQASKVPNDEHTYTCGDCHHFAIALHRWTGAPLVSIARKHSLPEDKWYGDDERDKFDFEHAHAGVLVGNNLIADVNGIHKFESTASGCLWFARVDNASPPYLDNIGNDEELLTSYYADHDETIIRSAMNDAVKWGCVALVNTYLKNQNKHL